MLYNAVKILEMKYEDKMEKLKDKMRVDKETFAKTLEAEGIPVKAHYMKPMNERIWIKEKKTYGNSACPWMCSRARDINYTHCCPVAEKALEDHMTLHIHECWTEKEIKDTLKALRKVERASSIQDNKRGGANAEPEHLETQRNLKIPSEVVKPIKA